MLKKIKHIIKHNDTKILIGDTVLNPNVINAIDDETKTQFTTDDEYVVKKIVNYPIAGETNIHLYQIYSLNDGVLHFYATHFKPLHIGGDYFNEIYYDEFDKLKAETLYDALMEFAEFAEQYAN